MLLFKNLVSLKEGEDLSELNSRNIVVPNATRINAGITRRGQFAGSALVAHGAFHRTRGR